MPGVPRKGSWVAGARRPPNSLWLLLSLEQGQPCVGLTGGTPRLSGITWLPQ